MWKGYQWARELISETQKDFTNSVDAAFRLGHEDVFLIKVLLDQGQDWARKHWNPQKSLSPKWPWCEALTNKFQVSIPCAFCA